MSDATAMSQVSDNEIDGLARVMIERHGTAAAREAAGRVNTMIDDGDWDGRDVWARVVQAIHECQNGFGGPPWRS